MAKKGTSPWLYIGCGCFALVGLVVAAVIAVGIFGASVANRYIEDLKDPASRDERARAILRAAKLPEGYHALLFFKIPLIMDAVVLSDAPPETLGGAQLEDFSPLDSRYLGEHLFVYLAIRSGDGDVESVFKGRRGRGELQFDLGSSFDSNEQVSSGSFPVDGGRLDYTVHLGELNTEDGDRVPGMYSEMVIDCAGDDKARLAVWFVRDPEGAGGETPDRPGTPGDGTPDEHTPEGGTPGDEKALRSFMDHFRLCAAG